MSRVVALPRLDPASYRRHALHGEERIFVEKNCYVDIWIALLHALDCEPRAMLPFVLALDFEGDQWTFFKPSHDELRILYGIGVNELNVWRPLGEHAQEQLGAGKLIATEADAFWLPDTGGTDYRQKHTKTTIVLVDFDARRQRLGYFHNAGYHALEGDDFRQLFRIGTPRDATALPLYAELVRIDRLVRRPEPELRQHSRALLRRHLMRRPLENPVVRFGQRFADELPRLSDAGLPTYHAWAFATVRQLGAAFELLALHLDWLGDPALMPATSAFTRLGQAAKTFILKAARAVHGRRPLDASPLVDEMATAWQTGLRALEAALG